MKQSTMALLAVGGVAAAGTAIYFATKGSSTTAYAAPAAQAPPTQIPPAGVVTTPANPSIELVSAQTVSITVPIGRPLSIALPPGATWVSLSGTAAPSTPLVSAGLTSPAVINAADGVFVGVWTLNGATHTGSVIVTALPPPVGA